MKSTIQSWLPRLHLNSLVIIVCLLLSTSNVGCASKKHRFKDPYLVQFVISYQKEGAKFATINQHRLADNIDSLEVKFAPARSNSELGYFYEDYHDRMVVINEDTFFELDYDAQEQLLFHELTHALFHARHSNEMLTTKCAKSIMHKYHQGKCYNETTKDKYLNQLFLVDKDNKL